MNTLLKLCFAAVLIFQKVSAAPTASNPWQCKNSICRFHPSKEGQTSWDKWDGLKTIVNFGASYATTGSEEDILNPKAPYKTYSNGPNFIDYMTNGKNKSLIYTKSYAVPGSPVSYYALHEPKRTTLLTEVDQYLADIKKGDLKDLSPNDTLYTSEFGINDINYSGKNYAKDEPTIFQKYQSAFDKLYTSGARNFLILDVPPIDQSPQAAKAGKATADLWSNSVTSFNKQVINMITTLGDKYPDAIFFKMGLNGLFETVIKDPSYSPATKVYKDTKDICEAYETAASGSKGDSLPSIDYKDPKCQYSVNEYFWLSGYHPTYPMHDTMASEIAEGLQDL